MSTKRRKAREDAARYERDIEKMISAYVAATGDNDWNRMKVAAWAIKNGLWEQQRLNAVKELAKTISRVAGKATFTDEDGNTVRKYHSWRLGEDQPMLWSAMDKITVENMTYSINARRDKLVGGALRAIIDSEYFNKHHNPGDPIEFETDLTKDVNEKRQPTLYDDVPPDEKERK